MSATMPTQAAVFGAVLRLVFDGATYATSSTASASSQPLTGDTGWIALPNCESFETQTENKVHEPEFVSSGFRTRGDALVSGGKRKHTATFNQLDVRILQFAANRATLDGTTASAKPMAGPVKRCWLEVKFYNSDGTLCKTLTVWCRPVVTEVPQASDNIAQVKIDFYEIENSLNAELIA